MSIGGVGEEDFDEVEVKKAGRDGSKKDVAHLEEVQVAIKDEPSHASEQDNRPRDGEGDIGLSYGVKVDDPTPVATFRADVDHFGEAVGIQLELNDVLAGWEIVRGKCGRQTSRLEVTYWRAEREAIAGRPSIWHAASKAPPKHYKSGFDDWGLIGLIFKPKCRRHRKRRYCWGASQ
jgi:hypothetical protein